MLTFFREFIASLRTGGGRIFVSLFLVIFFSVIGMVFVYNPPATDDKVAVMAATALIGLIGLFAGVLSGSLRGNIPKNGNAVNDPGEH